jgi:hypothetical protein
MKERLGVVAAALVLAGSAAAQRLPDIVGHPENALILSDPAKSAAGVYKLDLSHTSVVGRVLHVPPRVCRPSQALPRRAPRSASTRGGERSAVSRSSGGIHSVRK